MFLQEEEFNDPNNHYQKPKTFLKSEENEEEVEDLNFNFQKNNSGGLKDLQRRYSGNNFSGIVQKGNTTDNNDDSNGNPNPL